jgi:hypothetical protein
MKNKGLKDEGERARAKALLQKSCSLLQKRRQDKPQCCERERKELML